MNVPTTGSPPQAVPATAVTLPADPVEVVARAAGEQRRILRAVSREIANQTWGKGITADAAKAIALWCERHGVDPTEVAVLGGNIYIEAGFYLRRLAAMLADGQVEYAYPDHVHVDPRLEALAQAEVAPEVQRRARDETARRLLERITYNIPDEAKAAVVFRIKLRSATHEIVGAKWCGGRKNDPVGDAFPAETAESRAARRAARYVIDAFPTLRAQVDQAEEEAKLMATRIRFREPVDGLTYANVSMEKDPYFRPSETEAMRLSEKSGPEVDAP